MPTKTISLRFKVAGILTDATSMVFSNSAGTYGVRDLTASTTLIAANTALTHEGTGLYSYVIDDLVAGHQYRYWIKRVYNGVTKIVEKTFTAPTDTDAPLSFPIVGCYWESVAEADAAADQLSGLTAYKAANEGQRGRALVLASADVDSAMRYQGRKYELSQVNEFPRVAYPSVSSPATTGVPTSTDATLAGGDVIWDWDSDENEAIVPPRVLQAVLFQADSILTGDREGRLQAISDGLASQSIEGASESYFQRGGGGASVPVSPLVLRAQQLMDFYRLRQGQML